MTRPRPDKAVILAAGLATRLRPLSGSLPKACVPVWNRPALHHTLDLLARWGVREALINLHHQPWRVVETARAWAGPIRLNFSFEPLEPLGTGGALRHAAWFLDERPFWLLNADVLADADPRPLLAAYRGAARPLAALWMVPDAGPRTVTLKNGAVATFTAPTPGAPGTCTFGGLHLLAREILDFLPPEPVSSIIRAYQNAMTAGRRIAGCTLPRSFWADIGTLPDYLDAHAAIRRAQQGRAPGARLGDPAVESRLRALRRHGVRVSGFAALAPGADAEPGASLHDAVLWPGAVAASGAHLRRAVVAENVRVAGPVTGVAVAAANLPGLTPFLRAAGWDPAATAAIPLGPRGSDRAFTRLQTQEQAAILVEYGRERRENSLYAAHTRFLAELGIRAPRLLAQDRRQRRLLLEDLGCRDLQSALQNLPDPERRALYRPVLALAARLHTLGAPAARACRLPLSPGFSPRLYRWERLYFATHFLQNRLGLPDANVAPILAELAALARQLGRLPRALIHRDLQSSNILLTPDGPALIDYQGMRFGAAAYDLASLLCDPYAALAEPLQDRLLADYRARVPFAMANSDFWGAAVQRLAQALGAYARLGAQPPTAAFARHIPAAVNMMRRALRRLGHTAAPRLSALLNHTDAI